VIRVAALAGMAAGGYLAYEGWRQQQALDAQLAQANALNLLPAVQPAGPTLIVVTALGGLVIFAASLVLLFMSRLAKDYR
jgi:uncharacterized membrane protein YebE (DUF533 family)